MEAYWGVHTAWALAQVKHAAALPNGEIGVLERTAVKLSKVCSDLRLLGSGPLAVWRRSTSGHDRPVRRSCRAK
ncbi:hypothetical protein [Streptomyces scabiei]|uniref:hypothetical protein n=1 Tax=Streptomyces scabiei TaxID=1930 RepID=UPI0038D44235